MPRLGTHQAESRDPEAKTSSSAVHVTGKLNESYPKYVASQV